MTYNEKIARWAGWRYHIEEELWLNPIKERGWAKLEPLPGYFTDAEAIGLLNTLVEKGYYPELSYLRTGSRWWVRLWQKVGAFSVPIYDDYEGKPTIHEAITSAVLAVIEKETLK